MNANSATSANGINSGTLNNYSDISGNKVDNLKIDSLLDCLVLFTALYHKPLSTAKLTAELALTNGEETPKLFSIDKAKTLFSYAAHKIGLKSSFIQIPFDQISPLHLPMIILLSNQSACILEKISKDSQEAKIIMPTEGGVEQWVETEVHKDKYIGFGFVIQKAFEHMDENSRTLHLNQKHWFWSTLILSRSIYQNVFYASLLINLFVLATPLFTMNVYDRIVPNNAIETLWVFAIATVIVYLLDTYFKFIRANLLEIAAKKSDVMMASIIFKKVLNLKMASIPTSVGAFANNLKAFDTLRNFLTNATMTALIDLPFSLLFLGVIWYIGGSIVLIPIIAMILIVGYALLMTKQIKASVKDSMSASTKKSSMLIETLNNLETIKTLGKLNHVQWKWEHSTNDIATNSMKTRLLSASIPAITEFIMQLNRVIVIIYGVYLIQAFELSMGGLIAIGILTGRALGPMGQVAGILTNYENTKASYDAINEIVSQPSERPAGKKFVTKPYFIGRIEFIDVTFAYPKTGFQILKNVSFTIEPGEQVAIIGRIGSGKSTIQKLILGLYEPDSGQILIDGIDINQIDPADLRKSIGYVAQDIMLFRGTLKDNITYRVSHCSDDDMIRASIISGASEFVKKHPKGYEMPIGERGQGLSGGQKQSIGIARAFLLDSPIMLMDEPSNAMDQLSESRLIESLGENIKGKTALLVTQKMKLLKIVTRIIVMKEGEVFIDAEKDVALKKLQELEKQSLLYNHKP